MKNRSYIPLSCAAAALAAIILSWSVDQVCADPGVKREIEEDKDLPKKGSLATSSLSGAASATFPDPFGGNDPSGREISPISGSVSRISSEQWEMKVFNNSKDSYSVSVDIIQRDLRGSEVRRDSFSYALKPESSKSEKLPIGPGAYMAELNLRHWSNLTKKVKAK